MQAFGPFAGREVVDFTQLGERSFFLIHGPTGAGKTTLLDALCFALYGDTSGGEREARAMRSDHAAPDLATEVELEFSLGSARYHVKRSPAQSRPKKKGEGQVEAAASAELEVWKDGGWAPLVQQSNKVSERIKELIGFDGAQFRQLIVLPQGRFREVLSADSKSRQAIMERLFRTELYSRIERALKDAAGDLAHQVDEIAQQRTGILNQAQAESGEALDQALVRAEEQLEAAQDTEGKALAQQKNAQAELAAGRQNAERLAEREAAEARLKALEEAQAEQEQRQNAIATAKRAEAVRPEEELRRTRTAERERKSEEASKATAEANNAAAQSDMAQAALKNEMAREAEREAAERRLIELDAAEQAWAVLDQARREKNQAEAQLKSLEAQQTKLGEDGETTRKNVDRLAGELLATRKLALDEAAQKHRHEQLKQQIRLHTELERARCAQTIAAKALGEAEARQERAARDHGEARQARNELEREWVAGQAARLAALLEAGSPCPVCGGHDHPAPAHAARLVTDADLEAARARALTAETAERQARAARDSAQLARDQAAGKVGQLGEALGEAARLDSGLLIEQAREAERSWQAARQAAGDCATLEKRHSEEVTKRDRQAEELHQFERARQDQQLALARLIAQADTAEQALPAALREDGALARAREQALTRKQALSAALEAARNREKEAAKRKAASAATAAACSEQLREADAALSEARTRLAAALSRHGFADEALWRAAQIGAEALAKLEREAEVFVQTLAAAHDRCARAREACRDLQAPDLDALELAASTADANATRETARAAGLRHQRDELARARRKLTELAGRCREIEERYAVLGRMAEVANGTNPQRISFQRYVLATLLDEVLEAASIRLLRMSRKRFELQRATGKADQRSAGGLDLEVFDHQTGCSRPANTLSGGEGFLASLSLALGLADVVQSRSGGIQLETLFVDEGFGTLDPESLDFAIDTLLSLQQGGRLVGIISHVAELKERIDTRLEVRPGDKGSEISVVC